MSSVELKVEYDLLKIEYDQMKSDLKIMIDASNDYKLIIKQLQKGEAPQLIEVTNPETGNIVESNADFIAIFQDRTNIMTTFFGSMGYSIAQVVDRLHVELGFFVDVANIFIKDSYTALHFKQSELLKKKQKVIDRLLFENMLQFEDTPQI